MSKRKHELTIDLVGDWPKPSSTDRNTLKHFGTSSMNRQLLCRRIGYHRSNPHFLHELFMKEWTDREIMKLGYSERVQIRSVHHQSVNSLCLDRMNQFLLSSGRDSIVGLYPVNSYDTLLDESAMCQKEIKPMAQIKKGENGNHRTSISSVIWYPFDTGMFMTSSFDYHVKVWDTQSMTSVTDFNLHSKVYSIDMSGVVGAGNGHNTLVACATDDNSIKLCDLLSGASIQQLSGHSQRVQCVKWSPTSEYVLASASDDHTIRLWDVRTSGWLLSMDQFKIHGSKPAKQQTEREENGETKKKKRKSDNAFSTSKAYNYSNEKVPTAHNRSIKSLCFSTNGQYLYSSSNDNKMMKWVVSTGANTLFNFPIMNNHTKPCQLICTGGRQSKYIFHASDTSIQVFNQENSELLNTLSNHIHYGNINSMCFDPDRHLLYTAGDDNTIVIWDKPSSSEESDRGNEMAVSLQDQDDWSD